MEIIVDVENQKKPSAPVVQFKPLETDAQKNLLQSSIQLFPKITSSLQFEEYCLNWGRKSQPFFQCLKCQIHKLCLICAIRCHSGHDLQPKATKETSCDCGNSCGASPKSNIPSKYPVFSPAFAPYLPVANDRAVKELSFPTAPTSIRFQGDLIFVCCAGDPNIHVCNEV